MAFHQLALHVDQAHPSELASLVAKRKALRINTVKNGASHPLSDHGGIGMIDAGGNVVPNLNRFRSIRGGIQERLARRLDGCASGMGLLDNGRWQLQ
jgi:hypothetical protein